MPQFHIKINQYDGFLRKYKLVGPTEWKIDITPELEDAGTFDEDDYVLHLVEHWFPGDVELFPIGEESLSEPMEDVPKVFLEEWI